MIKNSAWISPPEDIGERCPYFTKNAKISKKIKKAELSVTAIGVYTAKINGKRVGDFILAPGVTAYTKRLQYQTYDVTDMLESDNVIKIELGKGWHRGRISKKNSNINDVDGAIIAELAVDYEDGTSEVVYTDDSWDCYGGHIMFSDIYDGEHYDAAAKDVFLGKAKVNKGISKDTLIPQEGETVKEHERFAVSETIITPKGERVLDFGQNIAGYIEINVNAHEGEKISISFAETLDKDGCFYNENYRSAKSELEYICKEGENKYKAVFTFYGFRYIRLNECPESADEKCFTAVALYSDMERTGYIHTGIDKLNKLYENSIWSNKDNFIDFPTDCPQRDERQGWTGDVQIFCKTACYNFNAKKFYEKWLGDVRAEQTEKGAIPEIVPNFWDSCIPSAAWGDVVTIVPWRVYMMYGDKKVLEDNFEAMRRWVDFITNDTDDKYLWTGEEDRKTWKIKHFGDWLALDGDEENKFGSTPSEYIASAFYAYSTLLVVKAGKVLKKDVSEYEELYENIVKTFKKTFTEYKTQTECVLALYFDLCNDMEKTAKQLNDMILENGCKLNTGFVGTPYLLYALSDNGYSQTAYGLLLQEEHPSWLYEVNHGATTIWEHWDSIKDDGSFWSTHMNSFNHYAFGSVFDWVYSVAGGIRPTEENPGFKEAVIAPVPCKRIGSLEVEYKSVCGTIKSKWHYEGDKVIYEIETPVRAKIITDGKERIVEAGKYTFKKKPPLCKGR